ncbi:MAG: hypothetical protein HJJLKODD_02444 [Phycisphaerae bacterium]|nr:hypothetical protein [Phycisphaerae bacterium]
MSQHAMEQGLGLERLVERQVRNWELARQQQDDQTPAVETVHDFVAFSLQVGCGGRTVAEELARRLNWPFFDRQLLQAMAGDDALRQRLYETMDQRDQSWFEAAVRGLINGPYAQNDYFRRLCTTMLALARKSRAIFVGRAADLVLPAGRGLRVRLVAEEQRCVEGYMQEHDLTAAEARQAMQSIRQERTDFVMRHFGERATQPSRHDLTINLTLFTQEQALELILLALRQRRLWT